MAAAKNQFNITGVIINTGQQFNFTGNFVPQIGSVLFLDKQTVLQVAGIKYDLEQPEDPEQPSTISNNVIISCANIASKIVMP